jgi:hypothetical protein
MGFEATFTGRINDDLANKLRKNKDMTFVSEAFSKHFKNEK